MKNAGTSALLARAAESAIRYVNGAAERGVAPTDAAVAALPGLIEPFPESSCDPAEILGLLDGIGSPATVATTGGRYFGFVNGAMLPASLAANWLASAWNQNAAMRIMSPVAAQLEDIVIDWVCEALGLPLDCAGGLVTGATMANFTALAAARYALLARQGWNVVEDGMFHAPPIEVVVGAEVHASMLKALNMLGLGRNRVTVVEADGQGRMRAEQLPRLSPNAIVCIQAGNVNTGAFDPAASICDAAHEQGAWVHVDGAFGLWAAASPKYKYLASGFEKADSWATDAHKWPNAGYDCGLVIVKDAESLRASMGISAAYLPLGTMREPMHHTPEASRRARGVELWAALKSLGRSGLAELVERTCAHAQRFAAGLREAGFDILNDVVINQVLVSFGDAAKTEEVIRRVQQEGTCWCGGTVWQGKPLCASAYLPGRQLPATLIEACPPSFVWRAIDASLRTDPGIHRNRLLRYNRFSLSANRIRRTPDLSSSAAEVYMTFIVRKIIIIVLWSVACFPAAAQSPLNSILQPSSSTSSNSAKAPADPYDRTTPSGTVFGFLQAAQSGNYNIAAQYLQMSPAHRQSQGEQVASELKEVMDRTFAGSLKNVSTQAEGAPQSDVPLDRQNLGSMSSGDVEAELQLVRVTESGTKIWLISSDTLAKVPELYEQVQTRQVETRLPSVLVKHQFGGMPLWQWLALLLAVPIAAVVGWLVLMILEIPVRWWVRRHGHVDVANWRSVSGPAWLLVGTLAHRFLAAYVGIALLPRHYYVELTSVALIISANWLLWRFIRWFLRRVRNRALAHGHGGTGSLMLLGERMLKAAVFVMAVLAVLGDLGFNMSTALAGLGIGGLAIGFGAQQTIANLFGGVSVLGDEVIRVGDVCRFGDRTGTVEDIGLRSTRVRTDERTLLAIPNGTVATINVENLSRRDKILFKTTVGVRPDTKSDHLRYVLSEIRRVFNDHSKIETSTLRVRLIEIAAALNVEIVSYVLTTDFNEFAEVREDLLLQIMGLVEESGTGVALPSQTLYIRRDSGLEKEKTQNAVKKISDLREQQAATQNQPPKSGTTS